MKRFAPLAILLLASVFFATTGFQCGSAETTSAKLYMQQKQWDKAEASLLKEVQKNEKDEEAWFLLGQVRLETKHYKEMNEAYTHALQVSDVHKVDINRNRIAIWGLQYNEGVKYYNQGHDDPTAYDKALDAFRIAIDLAPDSSATYYVAALSNYAKKDLNSAMTMLTTAVEKKPTFSEASRLLGQIHYQRALDCMAAKDSVGTKAEFEKSAQAFEATYKSEPDSVINITNLIDVYERLKQEDKALAITRDAVAKDPGNSLFRYAYGVFLLKQEKYEQSVEQFEKALAINPSYADARYNLGVSYLNWGVGLKKAAEEKAEAQQKVAPKGKQVKVDDSYLEKFKSALPHLEKSAELRSDDSGLWLNLGRLYAILNQQEKSKAAFKKADELTKTTK